MEEAGAEYYCSVCNAVITEDDILDGLAVRRFQEVYCFDHFKKRFPDECEDHPGMRVTVKCSSCGKWVCSDCAIELAGSTVCTRCKALRVYELRTGAPYAMVAKNEYYEKYKKKSSLAVLILVLAIVGWFVCSPLLLVVIILYAVHRSRVARGIELPDVKATIGFILAVIPFVFIVVIVIIMLIAEVV